MSSVGNNAKKILRLKRTVNNFTKAFHHYHTYLTLSACQGLKVTADVDHLSATATLTLTSFNLFRMEGEGRKPPPLPPSVFPLLRFKTQ